MFVSRENFRNQGEIRGEKSGGERRETERKKEKNLDSGASVVLGCRREEEKREKIAVQREREREREGREERGERREEIVSVSLSVFIFGVSGVYFSEHAPFTCTPNRLRFVKN